MPISETTPASPSLTAPVIDCEPPAHPLEAGSPPAVSQTRARYTPTRLRRPSPRRLRLVEPPREHLPPAGAAQFAEMALRLVLEVVDRRRPPGQLRHLTSPPLIDVVVTLTHTRHDTAATLRRVRLRAADRPAAAEVFATYTRGPRVRAIAARVEFDGSRWQLTALQLG